MARPTKYQENYAEQAYKLCLLGATDKDLAEFFEVTESTINEWKLNFPQFSESIKEGKSAADANVAKSLYHRALGYSHEDIDIRTVAIGNNQGSEIVKTPIVKHYPPDTVAGIFWLKNRNPNRWRDKQEVEVSGLDFRVGLIDSSKDEE